MKSYNSLEEFKVNFKTIVTIGTFDGVHLGHRYIINHLNKIAKREGGESVLLTFSPHPRLVLYGDNSHIKLIDTLEEKKIKLEKIGLQNFVVQKFSKEFSRMKYINFVRDILVKKLSVDYLVIGYDHHFGRNREGSINELKELAELYDFKLEQIPPQKEKNIAVSSTKIRNLLYEGDIQTANQFLAHKFMISGMVVDGNKLGRTIGFPTANIKVEKNKIIPKAGVYFVKVILSKDTFYGMLNIGAKTNKIEVNIFDFSDNIYGEKILVEFLSWIRNPKDFKDKLELKNQLNKDEKKCRKFLLK